MNPAELTASTLVPLSLSGIERGTEFSGNYQHFEGAKRSGFRGWFYFPNLEPSQQLTRPIRSELQRRSHWLYNNVGLAKSIIDRSARYETGTGLWPKSRTSKPEWNKLANNHFHDRVSDPEVFDLAGEVNYYTAQTLIRRHVKLHGDAFGLPVLSAGGTPQMRFIPGYAVDNANIPLDQSHWRDGIKANEFGRPLQYRVVQNDRSQYTDVSAADMWRFRDHQWIGAVRPPPLLHHAIKHLFDIDDILFFEKAGVRLSSQIGYVLTVNGDGGGAPKIQLPGAGTPEQVDDGNNGKLTVQKVFGGASTTVPELNPGEKLDTIQSNRTPASFTGFLDYLVRDAAWGSEYSPEFLWFLAGIGGAPMRYIIEDAQMTIDDKQQNLLIPQFCKRFHTFFLWNEIKADRLPYPGDDWWRADHMTPRKTTVDKGREGKLDDDRLATGKLSPRLYYGPLGLDEEDVEDDIIESVKRRMTKCAAAGLEYDEVFRPPPGTAAQPEPLDPGLDVNGDPIKPGNAAE